MLDFADFDFRTSTLKKRGVRTVPETKEAFLRRVEKFLSQGNRELINLETRENGVRVWYKEL
jgi:hypothetical protein